MGDGAEAIVLDAPQEAVRETPTNDQAQGTSGQTSSPATDGEGTASPAAQTAAQSPQVDIDSLLQNEDVVNKLLAHERVKQQIDHRARTVRQTDFERAVEARLQAIRQQEQADRELTEREAALRAKLEADEYELGAQTKEEVKGQLGELEQQRATQAREIHMAQLRGEITPRVAQEMYAAMSDEEYSERVLADPDLTDEEKRQLYWKTGPWASRKEWLKAVDDARIERKVAKLLKAKLPTEVEARLLEQTGSDRDKMQSVPNTPQGAGAASDSEFLARVASGGDYDKARMISKLKDWDIF